MLLRPARFLLGIALAAVAGIPAQAASILVEGVVQSAVGHGVPGARVELRPVVSRYEAGLAELEEVRGGEPAPVAKAGTDIMGRFRLSVPQAGLWRLVARADGFVPMEISALPILEEIRLPRVTLRSDAGLIVRVVDSVGNPVPGAQVLGKTGKPMLWGTSDWQPVRRVAMTGLEGTLRLPRAAIEPLLLWAERPGFPAQGGNLAEGRETVLRLQSGVVRFLVALNAEGHPLPEALFRDPRSSLALGRFDGQHPLVLAAPATGLWDLRLELADGRRMSFRTAKAQRPEGTAPIPLCLSAAAPLAGRIVDAAGRRPLAGALVWVGGDPASVTRTDAAGAYRLVAQVPGGRLDLRAAAAGHQPGQLKVALPSRPSESLRRTPDLPLVPSPVPAITGLVVDEAARPLANAEIRVVRPEPAERSVAEEPRLARTSPDGSFRIAPLQAGGLYVLTASRPGFAPQTLAVTLPLPPRSRGPVRLALTRGRTVSGLVLDPRQRPIPGATVKLTAGLPESPVETQPELGPFRAETDAAGRFQVPGLPTGFFELRIEGPELAPLPAKVISVPKGEGQVDLGTFTLEGRSRIGGWIVDPDGRPVEGAEIWVVPVDSTPITQAERQAGPAVLTGRDGHFELRDRSVGDHEKLRACRKGFLPAEFEAQGPEASEPRVALTPSIQISGRVVNADGDPVPRAQVSAFLSGHELEENFSLPDPPCPFEGSTTVNAEGAFALELKGPGRYDVTALGAGYLLAKQDHVLVPPEGLDGVELQMGGGTLVAGHVSDPEGHSVAGALIVLSSSRSYSQTSSDGSGDYLLEGVAAGDDSLVIEHPDFETVATDVHIPNTAYRMDLTLLTPKSRLEARGRVTDPDGTPVEGAIVSCYNIKTATLADGSFAVRVNKGDERLVVEKEGFAVAALDVIVENRSLDGLEIRLGHGLTLRGRVLGVDPATVTGSSVLVYASGGRQTPVPIDSAGRFEIHNLPLEAWDVSARAGNRNAWDHFTPPPGQAEVVHDLEFAPVSEVWGRITGPEGEPIAGASLQLVDGQGANFHTQTLVDGSFVLEVPDGTYTLSASAEGYSGREADQSVVVAGAPVGNVELQLGANIILTGRLLGLETGDILKELQVEGPRAFHPGTWTVDQEGHYRQTGFWPGDWTVSATFLLGDQERYASGTVHIPSGATEATLDLDFRIGDLSLDRP
ncbi:MAG TPA: carboxypeptidase-like regulatory domain-containing protein [Thermoanaerobaculia bacterium]|jgi:hypothetical protein|nr:carboxypeptidase-like regulatory domain-containing protein [Thermoanaerobaculia bacterium]